MREEAAYVRFRLPCGSVEVQTEHVEYPQKWPKVSASYWPYLNAANDLSQFTAIVHRDSGDEPFCR
jgi:hypothetical protein